MAKVEVFLQVACKACRSVTLFMGQYSYQLEDRPKYESPTCEVYFASDFGDLNDGDMTGATPVAIKFPKEQSHFDSELSVRRKKSNNEPRFSSDYVTSDLACYSPEKTEGCAEAINLSKKASYCIVLKRGDRNLLEVTSAENLFLQR